MQGATGLSLGVYRFSTLSEPEKVSWSVASVFEKTRQGIKDCSGQPINKSSKVRFSEDVSVFLFPRVYSLVELSFTRPVDTTLPYVGYTAVSIW